MSYFPTTPPRGKLPVEFVDSLIEMWLKKGQDVFTSRTLSVLKRQMTELTFDANTIKMWLDELTEWNKQAA